MGETKTTLEKVTEVEKQIDLAAKKYLGIKEDVDMESYDERYYNPKTLQYDAFVTGASTAFKIIGKELKILL